MSFVEKKKKKNGDEQEHASRCCCRRRRRCPLPVWLFFRMGFLSGEKGGGRSGGLLSLSARQASEVTRERERAYRRNCKNHFSFFFRWWSGLRGLEKKKKKNWSLHKFSTKKKSCLLLFLFFPKRWRPSSPPAQRSPRRRARWRPPRLPLPSLSAPPRRGASR